MPRAKAHAFEAAIRKVGINPYVRVPAAAAPLPPAFEAALKKHAKARKALDALPPYRRKEILRYLGSARRAETLERNVAKAIDYLLGRPITGAVAITRKRPA